MIRVSPCSIPSVVRPKGGVEEGSKVVVIDNEAGAGTIETVAMCGPITAGIQDRIIRYGSGAPTAMRCMGFS